jgi:hypothetical protein
MFGRRKAGGKVAEEKAEKKDDGGGMIARIAATMVIEITNVTFVFESDGMDAELVVGRLALPAVAPTTELGSVFQRHVSLEGMFIRVGTSQLLEPTGARGDLVIRTSDFSLARSVGWDGLRGHHKVSPRQQHPPHAPTSHRTHHTRQTTLSPIQRGRHARSRQRLARDRSARLLSTAFSLFEESEDCERARAPPSHGATERW